MNQKSKIEISHASSSVVNQYYDLTNEIIIKILGLTPEAVYVTDLTEMDMLTRSKKIISNTKKHYGIIITEDYFKDKYLKDYILMIVDNQIKN